MSSSSVSPHSAHEIGTSICHGCKSFATSLFLMTLCSNSCLHVKSHGQSIHWVNLVCPRPCHWVAEYSELTILLQLNCLMSCNWATKWLGYMKFWQLVPEHWCASITVLASMLRSLSSRSLKYMGGDLRRSNWEASFLIYLSVTWR